MNAETRLLPAVGSPHLPSMESPAANVVYPKSKKLKHGTARTWHTLQDMSQKMALNSRLSWSRLKTGKFSKTQVVVLFTMLLVTVSVMSRVVTRLLDLYEGVCDFIGLLVVSQGVSMFIAGLLSMTGLPKSMSLFAAESLVMVLWKLKTVPSVIDPVQNLPARRVQFVDERQDFSKEQTSHYGWSTSSLLNCVSVCTGGSAFVYGRL